MLMLSDGPNSKGETVKRLLGRAGVAMAVIATILVGTFVAATPALAAPPNCKPSLRIIFSTGVLVVTNRLLCSNPDGPDKRDLPIEITKEVRDSDGITEFVTVALGFGGISYTCMGTTPTKFRVNDANERFLACG